MKALDRKDLHSDNKQPLSPRTAVPLTVGPGNRFSNPAHYLSNKLVSFTACVTAQDEDLSNS